MFDDESDALFSNLNTLRIQNCHLQKIPSKMLSKTPNLKTLSLRGNVISNVGKDSFKAVKQVTRITNSTI